MDANQSTSETGPTAEAVSLGLLHQDIRFVVWGWAALLIPSSLVLAYEDAQPHYWYLAKLTTRACELTFLLLVALRAVRSIRREKTVVRLLGLGAFFTFGMTTWFLTTLPLQLFNITLPAAARAALALILVGGFTTTYLYFFFFMPIVLGFGNIREYFRMVRFYTVIDRYSPLRATVAPAGLTYLVMGLLSAISPDGRMVIVSYLTEVCAELYWILSSYLGVAYGLTLLPEKSWRDRGLDPYRQSRLTTLALRAPAWLSSALTLRYGLQFLALSMLVWTGNYLRLSQLPPAAEIRLQSVQAEEKRVLLQLELGDPQYHFRGFHPIQFRLAGSEQRVISSSPHSAFLEGDSRDVRFALPRDRERVVLHLEFQTDRPAEEVRLLEDLYLWYGGSRIVLLSMK